MRVVTEVYFNGREMVRKKRIIADVKPENRVVLKKKEKNNN